MFKIKLLDSALEDLGNISAYISADNPYQSKVVLENINIEFSIKLKIKQFI
ncbi:MAG: hypothetical protein PHR68_01520 [Candidatus Gracilibacteria bacterium]|nr:hypothetical protein [Candidatus Gracilibacteria bacterium]